MSKTKTNIFRFGHGISLFNTRTFHMVIQSLILEWVPSVVPVQLFRIGQLLLPIFPGEHTTMSGRRYIEMIKYTNARERFIPENELIVILTTMTNSFLQYTTTPEEYRIQRYEGGSTLFGVNQLKYYSFINKVRLDRNLTISQFH
jgi:hypothetical protein